MDSLTRERRSWNMRRIKSKDTTPEMIVRRFIHGHGIRYRLHCSKLPGRPDIVLKSRSTVIQVMGCFWHGHKCSRAHMPRSNQDYWSTKIQRNADRDERNRAKLEALGWTVLVVWECECSLGDLENLLQSLLARGAH